MQNILRFNSSVSSIGLFAFVPDSFNIIGSLAWVCLSEIYNQKIHMRNDREYFGRFNLLDDVLVRSPVMSASTVPFVNWFHSSVTMPVFSTPRQGKITQKIQLVPTI